MTSLKEQGGESRHSIRSHAHSDSLPDRRRQGGIQSHSTLARLQSRKDGRPDREACNLDLNTTHLCILLRGMAVRVQKLIDRCIYITCSPSKDEAGQSKLPFYQQDALISRRDRRLASFRAI
jgi:hypothetical protein